MMQADRSARANRVILVAAGALILAAASLVATAYWPGLMTWDAVRQYDQATSGQFDDWHPPAMEWLWRRLLPIHTGPAPMLLVQLTLFWGGMALLAGWAMHAGRRSTAAAIIACGLMPLALALTGAVLKDCLMAGLLLCAAGLLARAGPERRALAARATGIALIVCAATLRFNAVAACLPLAVALLPRRWRAEPVRFALCTAMAAAVLFAAMPLVNRLIGTARSGVELSLIIFDLGGIGAYSGAEVFPPSLRVAGSVAVNRRCYSATKWDSYSDWVDPICPLGFTCFRAVAATGAFDPGLVWMAAIARHPLAYARHRLIHFNINARFLVREEVERPVQIESAPNPWGYRVTPGPLLALVDTAARWQARTPLGWPATWLAVALGTLIAAPDLASRRLIVPLAASSLLYGLSYLGVSVAAELRYHLWTMLAAAIAAAIALTDTRRGSTLPRWRLWAACAPPTIVVLLGSLWRLA